MKKCVIMLALEVKPGYLRCHRVAMNLSVYQELSAEKSKVASVETRLSSQLSKREQEMIALQARMQASYQDHVAQTQGLNAKVSSHTQIFS